MFKVRGNAELFCSKTQRQKDTPAEARRLSQKASSGEEWLEPIFKEKDGNLTSIAKKR